MAGMKVKGRAVLPRVTCGMLALVMSGEEVDRRMKRRRRGMGNIGGMGGMGGMGGGG